MAGGIGVESLGNFCEPRAPLNRERVSGTTRSTNPAMNDQMTSFAYSRAARLWESPIKGTAQIGAKICSKALDDCSGRWKVPVQALSAARDNDGVLETVV